MGTNLCALLKHLVCLGCTHAQPKRSAIPTFRAMQAGHQPALKRARAAPNRPARSPPASSKSFASKALRRAEQLTQDVAAAIQASAVT